MQNNIRIAIVTPTYQRITLLRRFIRQVMRQDYDRWSLVIIHDGEGEQTREIVEKFARKDARIHFAHTKRRNNDFGVTPRILGAKIAAECNLADYVVFWDDDNSFYPGALTCIVQALQAAGMPEVLLVPIRYGTSALPPSLPVGQMRLGQVDTANFVVRSPLAAQVYERVLRRIGRGASPYTQDFFFLEALRQEIAPSGVHLATCPPIGRYDGLRPFVTLRWMLRLPSLGMSRFAWYRWWRRRFLPRK